MLRRIISERQLKKELVEGNNANPVTTRVSPTDEMVDSANILVSRVKAAKTLGDISKCI